jgi:hypothetical protein
MLAAGHLPVALGSAAATRESLNFQFPTGARLADILGHYQFYLTNNARLRRAGYRLTSAQSKYVKARILESMSALGNRQVQGQARKSQDRPGEPGSQCLLPRIPLIPTSPPARRTKSETKQNRGREKGIQNALARILLG